MKKMFYLMAIVLVTLTLSLGCTENARVKTFGGEATIQLKTGEQLEMVTWKNDDLWVLTTKRPANQKAAKHTFKEQSSFGVMEGTYTIIEN